MVYNVNTLTLDKLQNMLFYFRTLHLDVLTLTDTRTTPRSQAFFSRSIGWDMTNYSLGTSHHFVDAKTSLKGRGCVGGQLWILNNRLHGVKFLPIVEFGVCTELQAVFGLRPIRIQSVYWPCKPSQITDGNSLWNLVRWHYRVDQPMDLVQNLMTTRLSHLSPDTPIIIGGDFNSDVWKKDTLHLLKFIEDNNLKMYKEPEDKLPSFQKNGHTSRIDHILNRGNLSLHYCQPIDLHESLDDHLPLLAIIRLSGAKAQRNCKAKLMSRTCPNRKDPNTIARVKEFAETFNFEQPGPAATILDQFCAGTAAAAGVDYSKKSKKKDGWSPISQALFINLRIAILIIRHSDGLNRPDCLQWTKTSYQKGLKLLLCRWKSMIASLTKDTAERVLLRNTGKYGYDFWVHATWRKISLDANTAYLHIRNELQGRKRKDRRIIRGGRTKKIEDCREAKQIGFAIRALNENKPPSFFMDELRLGDKLITKAADIAEAVLVNFMDWFKAKLNPAAGNLSNPDAHWSWAEDSLEDFITHNSQTKIPPHLLTALHKHLQRKNISPTVLESFQSTVMLPPTIAEFSNCIDHAPDHTAAGLSGLTFDCIKLWPLETRAQVLQLLNDLWTNKQVPASWKWRWLVPIPKCEKPQLSDLRPLVLIEAIRKIWTGIFVHRILSYLHQNNILCLNQHGFLWGRSTESASIILLNALETAHEWRSRLYISSWDLKRAFDSVPTAMLTWSLIRIGIPPSLAEYLACMDIDGYVAIRSPYTTAIHAKEGTDGLLKKNQHFTPTKGTGQGDKTSPLLWDAFCDILLSALADLDIGPFFFQDHNGNNHVTPDIGYADDVISLQGNTAALQAKADIISAFAIIMCMIIHIDKLRLFGIEWGNHHRPSDDSITIHTFDWTPVVVPIQPTGDLKHLGILWGMDLLNLTQLQNTIKLLTDWCKYASYSNLSLASKKLALETSTYQKIIYYAKFATWDTAQLLQLDRIIANFIRKIHKTAFSLPMDLLFLPKKHGGLGYKKLSHEIYKAQFAMTWRLLATNGTSKLATLSCIHRGFKSAGQFSPLCLDNQMEPSLLDRYWTHGLYDYLALMNMKLLRNGPTPDSCNNWIGATLPPDIRTTYSRLGIYSPGECLMEGDEDDLPVRYNLPPFPPCPAQPIYLRPGQVWQQNINTTWEILCINPDHLQVVRWQPTPADPSILYLDEDNFCLGSGSNHLIHKADLLLLEPCLLLTLDIEHHRRNGNTHSKILSKRPRAFLWPPTHSPSPLQHLADILSLSTTPLPEKVRDIYTDGSWTTTGTVSNRITANGTTRAHGAAVLEDISQRGPPAYFGIKLVGSLDRPKSAYIYELLSIGLASLLSSLIETTGCIRSDCVSAIKTVTKCWLRRGLYRTYPLIGAALNTLKPSRITHIRAHPERKKLDKAWTDQDCGIYIADRTASSAPCSTTKAGLLDSTLLDILVLPLPYTYLDCDNSHVLEDLNDRFHRLAAERYLLKRDAYRTNDPVNPRPAKWAGMNLPLMAHITGTSKLNLSDGNKATHALFDWYFTGSNRIKGNPLADDKCVLCGKSENRPHIIHHCSHPELIRLRNDIMEELRGDISLMTPGPACAAAWTIFGLMESPITGHQIMLGQLDPDLRAIISKEPTLTTILSPPDWTCIDKILCKAGLASLNILRTHIRLTGWHLSGKKPSGLVRTTLGLQRSITACFNPISCTVQNKSCSSSSSSSSLSSSSSSSSSSPSSSSSSSSSSSTTADSAPAPASSSCSPFLEEGSELDVLSTIRHNRIIPLNEGVASADEEDIIVKRKWHSRNVIADDADMILIRGRGTWRPYDPATGPQASSNKKFMKSVNRSSQLATPTPHAEPDQPTLPLTTVMDLNPSTSPITYPPPTTTCTALSRSTLKRFPPP